MRRFQSFQYAVAAIACLGLVLPPAARAVEVNRAPAQASAAETPAVLDISLGEAGTLVGQVVNAQGAPLAQTGVSVRRAGADVASAVTDAEGFFSVRGLQGGLYEVRAAGGGGIFRLWTAGASPPSAHAKLLIVAGQQVTRGACPRLSNMDPHAALILGGIVVGVLAAGVVAWAVTEHDSAS